MVYCGHVGQSHGCLRDQLLDLSQSATGFLYLPPNEKHVLSDSSSWKEKHSVSGWLWQAQELSASSRGLLHSSQVSKTFSNINFHFPY